MGRALDGCLLVHARPSLTRLRSASIGLALGAVLLAVATATAADTLRVGLLSLQGPPGSERELAALGARARTILPALEADLGVRFRARFRMFLIPAGPLRDPEIARLDSSAPPWAAGYLLPAQRVGAIRVARASQYPYGTLESVLAHEATHMLLRDSGVRDLPLWFEEGVATWQGRRWTLEDAMLYSTSLLTSDLPRLAELDSAFHATEAEARLAYAASFAFVSRAVRRSPPGFLGNLLRVARDRPFAEAWRAASGAPLAVAEADWRRDSLIRYRWIPVLTASSTLWILITFLAVFVGVRKRERLSRQRREWKEEDEESEPLEEIRPDPGPR